jgi:hypothetical protein
LKLEVVRKRVVRQKRCFEGFRFYQTTIKGGATMERRQEPSGTKGKVLELKEIRKLKEDGEDEYVSMMRDDAISLFQKMPLVDQGIDFLVGKAQVKDSMESEWLQFEKRVPEVGLLRTIASFLEEERQDLLKRFDLPDEVETWIVMKAEICHLVFERDFRAIKAMFDRIEFGYLNRCTALGCGVRSKSPERPLLAAQFTFGDQEVRSVDDPSRFLLLAKCLIDATKDLLAAYSKDLRQEERSRLRKTLEEIKAVVALAGSSLEHSGKNGTMDPVIMEKDRPER